MAQTKAQLLSPVGVVTATSTVIGSAVTITSTGINATSGVITATTFSGSLTGNVTGNVTGTAGGLSGTPNITVGNITSGNINSSGVVTATTFSGALTGNVTGNATGLSGNPSITVTNATINGTLSVGGTSVILNAATLQINDKDITLGITTNALGNNVANDTTANHGGIAIASTVGTPLIDIPIDGSNSDLPTNKQIMWVKQNHYTGLATDSWIFNYPISIGNTATVQNGSRLTVGTGFTIYSTLTDTQDVRVGGGLTITGQLDLRGASETVSVGATYDLGGGKVVLECNAQNGTVFTHNLANGTVGIVSLRNFPATKNSVTTYTILFTQASTAPTAGVGNTTVGTGIGTNIRLTPLGVAGFTTSARVATASTVTLSTTADDIDIVTISIHYNGSGNTTPGNYRTFATGNTGFRFGTVGF